MVDTPSPTPAATPTLTTENPSFGRKVLGHLRRTFLAGVLIIFPVVVTYWVVRFLFDIIDGILSPAIEQFLGLHIPGLGAMLLILLVYLLGLLAANVIGRKGIGLAQQALLKIPLISGIYGAMKALMESLIGAPGSGNRPRRVVLVEYPGPNLWTIAFLMSMSTDEKGKELAVVYIPTSPTPQTGWVAIVHRERVFETELSVQQAMRLVLSGGVLSPEKIGRKPLAAI